MQTKELLFDSQARESIQKGIDILANAVKVTLGPKGRNVIIEKENGLPHITKDGVTVARSINLEDKFENIGAQIVKSVADKTNTDVGDGPQPLDSKILTPNGWINMGDIKVNQPICGTNNTIQFVEGVYPKGKKEIYKVYFSGGSVVRCCKDHLWNVSYDRYVDKTLPLNVIMENYKKTQKDGSTKYKYYVKTTSVDFVEYPSKMPIDPYFLGVLLGDGSLSGKNRSTIELSLGKDKKHILDKIVLPRGIEMKFTWVENKNYYRIKFTRINDSYSTLRDIIKSIGLLGTTSKNKFIPDIYFYSSVETRKKLLQGLIDTDAHINKRGLFEFSTISKKLANDFINLCRSLGIQVSFKEKDRSNSGGYSTTNIFVINEMKGYKHGNKIINIEPTGEYVEMQCIKVSNKDNLYITDDYIVTHNTTTATVLAQAIVNYGLQALKEGVNPVILKKGIDEAIEIVVKELKNKAVQVNGNVDLIKQIATVSANNDNTIGMLITDAIIPIGEYGIVNIEEGTAIEDKLEIIPGMRFERGYYSINFVNTSKGTVEYDNPLIIVSNEKIANNDDIMPFLNFAKKSNKPLLVIGEALEGEAYRTVALNVMEKRVQFAFVKSPAFGDRRKEMMEDISILIGATLIDKHRGIMLQDTDKIKFGTCEKIIISKDHTTIINGKGDKNMIDSRVENIKSILLTANEDEKAILKDRLAKMTGSVANIYVGGSSEMEMKERKDRIEDALNATKAAIEEGIVPGGGVTLFRISAMLESVFNPDKNINLGIRIVQKALLEPFGQILANSGTEESGIGINILNKNFGEGYDSYNDKYVDMMLSGIIDPVKVTRMAVQNAGSIGGLFLTTNCVIAIKDKAENQGQSFNFPML